ncbi:MAG TPA: M3 family peptidase, partial [Trueperaceae bacterium]|nr:M3 family peptidase [Trueperaceae bacterium]
MTDNPLLRTHHHVAFADVNSGHYVPAVRSALSWARGELDALKRAEEPLDFDAVIGRLDELTEWPGRVFGLVRHLNDVINSPESRAAYNEVLPEYTGFMAGLSSDLELWNVIKRFASSAAAEDLGPLRRRHLDKIVEEFKRAGADLPDAERSRAQQLKVELAQLSTKFAENVLDSTNAFALLLGDDALAGLPEGVRRRAMVDAESHAADGYRFTLQAPSYRPFMKHSERRDLRHAMHEAFF